MKTFRLISRIFLSIVSAALVIASCAIRPDSPGPQPTPTPVIGAPVTLEVDPAATPQPISPYIYGGNNLVSSGNATRILESGLRFARENGGNNATKYNWEKKLSSHPDWYNNVYTNDWDAKAQYAEANFPNLNVMFAFQLLGQAAETTTQNFNDYAYNGSVWWSGVAQNLAGGGTVNPAGGPDALVEGNPALYLEDWLPADTVGILGHFFGSGAGQLSLDQGNFIYWSMDNEPEIWSGTHDDVMPTQCSGAAFMDKYEAVGVAARNANPDVKLTGPVTCNEWQWYSYSGDAGGRPDNLPWLQYFIKEVDARQDSTGRKLLDMVDIHFYPGETNPDDILQLHRVFFDETYDYPGARGLFTLNGGWDTSLRREYILKRARGWLAQYGLTNVGVGVTEMDVASSDPNVIAIWYASTIGEFMANGGEVFSPWSWKTGMWETLHLFSRFARDSFFPIAVTSADDHLVSAYGTVDSGSGDVTIFLVNRSRTQTRPTAFALEPGSFADGDYQTRRLSNLPGAETFVSHTNNALVSSTVALASDSFSIDLPPLSVTAVILE